MSELRTCAYLIIPIDEDQSPYTCGKRVYVNNETGEVARFCIHCMYKKAFLGRTSSYMKEHNLTLEEATAGKHPLPEKPDITRIYILTM